MRLGEFAAWVRRRRFASGCQGSGGLASCMPKSCGPCLASSWRQSAIRGRRRSPPLLHGYGAAGFSDFAAMLDGADLDAVFVVSPEPLHAAQALLAIARGIPVFLEKPLALTSAEGESIVQAAARARRARCRLASSSASTFSTRCSRPRLRAAGWVSSSLCARNATSPRPGSRTMVTARTRSTKPRSTTSTCCSGTPAAASRACRRCRKTSPACATLTPAGHCSSSPAER